MKLSEIEHGDSILVAQDLEQEYLQSLEYIQKELNMEQQANFNRENNSRVISDFDEETKDNDTAIIDHDTLELYLDNICRKFFDSTYAEFIAQHIITAHLKTTVEHLEDRDLICVSVKYPKEIDSLLGENMRALNREDDFYYYLLDYCEIDIEDLALKFAKKELNTEEIEHNHTSGDSADGTQFYDVYYTYKKTLIEIEIDEAALGNTWRAGKAELKQVAELYQEELKKQFPQYKFKVIPITDSWNGAKMIDNLEVDTSAAWDRALERAPAEWWE